MMDSKMIRSVTRNSTLSIEDISRDLGVSINTVKNWLRKGRLKGTLNSSRTGYLIDFKDYQTFLDSDDRYYCKHVGGEWLKKMVKRDYCDELLNDIRNIEIEFNSQEHGKSYSDGWNDAMARFSRAIKEFMIKK